MKTKTSFLLTAILLIIASFLAVAAKASPDEIYHEGDLVIEGDENYVIENVTFFIDGNITVKDSSKLIVRNAKVIVNSTYPWEYWVKVYDNAILTIENSLLQTYSQTNLNVEGGSLTMHGTTCCWAVVAGGGNVTIDSSHLSEEVLPAPPGVQISPIKPTACLFWKGYLPSRVEIIDSILPRVDLTFGSLGPDQSESVVEDIDLVGLRPGRKEELLINPAEGVYFEMRNSSTEMWIVEVSTYSRKRVIVRDSRLAGVYLSIADVPEMKISDLKPGLFSDQILLTTMEGGYLRLVNTEVIPQIPGEPVEARFKFLLYGGNITIKNCEAIQVGSFGDSRVLVKDCVVEMNVNLRGNETVRFVNTLIKSPINFWTGQTHDPAHGGDNHNLEFADSEIAKDVDIEVACRYGEIKGNVSILTSMDHVHWFFGTINREYPLIVEDENGNRLPNASIKLYDKDNKQVWAGSTGADGEALMSIMFTEENYEDSWVVMATSNGRDIWQEIGLLTSTPVILTIPTPVAFTPSSLNISPSEVNIGQIVTISISVANTGGEPGSYEATLKINGVVEARKEVVVAAGASEEVSFTTSKGAPGSYSVDVNGLTGSFRVQEAPVAVTKETNWVLVGEIIAGVVVVGLLIFFLRRRRSV